MKRHLISLCGLIGILLSSGCKEKEVVSLPASPQMEARYDRSVAPVLVDVEKGIQQRKSLKLSQIGSEIEYYRIGDATYGVKQVIDLPDSNAIITFNNPRIYYRKQGIPSKRYGFKALAYKWNNEMGGKSLFYDKKTSHMYVALSGKDTTSRGKDIPVVPFIGKLPALDTMLSIHNYIFPESVTDKYPLQLTYDKLLGFSSTGYTLCKYDTTGCFTGTIMTFNLMGDTLCKIPLSASTPKLNTEETPWFQTYYWNEAQDRMNFMVPYCDTVFQLRDAQTISPLYTIHIGPKGLNADSGTGQPVEEGKIWIRTLQENPRGLFFGLFQKGAIPITNWNGLPDESKPILTHQGLYLKDTGETYLLPDRSKGLENDLDEGMPYWPDGQMDNSLYMIRSVTEMRLLVKRTGSAKQKKLIEFLDDPKTLERDYMLIVVR